MKQTFSTYLLGASLWMLAVPATAGAQQAAEAQKARIAEQKAAAARQKAAAADARRKEAEQIIITRTGARNEKTVIEINGDAIIVNGQNIKELNGTVSVQRHRLRDVDALVAAPPAPPRPGASFNFNMDDNGLSLLSEDSSRAMLGVITSETERGAHIIGISKESGAEKAGLKAGDIITRIGDNKIKAASDVAEVMRKHKPGEKVSVTYLRDGKEQKTTAELSRWKGLSVNALGENFRVTVPGRVTPYGGNPNFNFREFKMDFSGDRPKLGISIQDTEDGKGVRVEDVDEESAAEKAGIRENDVITHFNDKAVNDVNDMRRELAANRDKVSNKVTLLRNGKAQTVEIKMPRKLKTADL